MKKILFLLGFISIVFTSCVKNSTVEPVPQQVDKGVFIVNQGNFGSGNSSLSYFDPSDDSVFNNVFYNTNNLPLGDVAQSMTIHDSLGYVVINNSAKIYVININTFKYVGKITGLVSPRNIYFLSTTKAYVTDMYSNSVFVINPESEQIIGQVPLGHHNSEQMVFYGNEAFTNSWSYDDKVMVIDVNSNQVIDSITVTKQPNSMVLDKNNKIWVLSDGGYTGSPYGQVKPALTRINPVTHTVEKVFEFSDINASPSNLTMNAAGDTLFYLYRSYSAGSIMNPGVYAMPIGSTSLPVAPMVSEGSHNFYGLGIDPHNSHVFVSDALNYQDNGKVFVYLTTGEISDSITVGINPGSFCFK